MKSFLLELADVLERHKGIIELGDYSADFGIKKLIGYEWSGRIDEDGDVNEKYLRALAAQ
jgi:hypothetical protein